MTETRESLPTASELRAHMAELELEKQKLLDLKRETAENAARKFADDFVHKSLSEDERQAVQKKIRYAVDNGELEVEVMRFPSSLCTDKGRAINNNLEGWPETLPGKARELYQSWEQRGKPAGYHFKALIVDFPGGIPGDVGIYISWAAG